MLLPFERIYAIRKHHAILPHWLYQIWYPINLQFSFKMQILSTMLIIYTSIEFIMQPGGYLNINMSSHQHRDFPYKVIKSYNWQSHDCLIFVMEIPIPVKSIDIETAQIAKFVGPTWGPPGSCWPQMGPILAPWTLLSGRAPGLLQCREFNIQILQNLQPFQSFHHFEIVYKAW